MANLQENPLLQEFKTKDHSVPFSKIKPEHFVPAQIEGIRLAKEKLAALKGNTAAPTFENTITALEAATEVVDPIGLIFGNLETANGDETLQALAKEMYPLYSALMSDITLDPTIFARVKSVYDQRTSLKLDKEEAQLLEKTYLSFVRNGALLDQKSKDRVRDIDQELAVLSPKFSENVLKSTNAFELWITDGKDLEGVPEGALEAGAAAAEAKGKKGQWFFNLQIPSYLPIAYYAKNRPLREKMWTAYSSRAFRNEFDNQETIKKTVGLRHERARILGYKTHAEFVLVERMAKDPATVQQFLDRLLKASKPAAQRDLDEVRAFAKEIDGLTDFKPWDFGYYSEKLKEKKYSFNEEDLRPYFKLENVVAGVFECARRLYGLTFKETAEVDKYHPEVKVYEIFDEAGKYMGLFTTDFFPRETKKNGAWMTAYREQGTWGGMLLRPHISIVCNFTKPTPTKPSLLTYDEVRTLFHEFGHALHGMLSQVKHRSLGGTNVYWDFVELPSQIMENWVTEKEGLDIFARHYETGVPIPAELFAKVKRAQQFQAGWATLRQLNFALMDMAWHTVEPSTIADVDQFEDFATGETRLLAKVPGTNTSCAFSHIFAGGYAAGYYSYKWAEVLDADAFEFFKEKGIFSREVADRFKNDILSRGGSEHPMDLYKRFRGREPDPNALLRRDGLI